MMKQGIPTPFLNTLRLAEHELIQNTVNVQHVDAAISIGRMDLSHPPDLEFYNELLLKRDMLVCIISNDICLN
jgi:hypothetical protein